MRYLLAGSGPAAISAAEEIRREDPEGEIVMVTADRHPACSPVMLSYFVSGRYPRQSLFFRDPAAWAEAWRVELLCGTAVTATDTGRRTVALSTGGELSYDRLLIATGAVPVVPPIPGIDSRGVCTFRTFADAEGILAAARSGENVCIMGGGFIGIKLACHLRDRGFPVLVFEKEPRLASRIFDQRASDIVQEQLRRHGVYVETAAAISEIVHDEGQLCGIRLDDGRSFPARVVVVAVGVRPNTAFAGPSIGVSREGIPVNGRMETIAGGVYAAGDVVAAIDSLTLQRGNQAIWPAATRQGRVAGANMAGRCRSYLHHFSQNALNLEGLQVTTAGHPCEPAGNGVQVYEKQDGNGYRKWVVRSGALIGFILIGNPSPAALWLGLMKRGELLADPAGAFARGGRISEAAASGGFPEGALWRGRARPGYKYQLPAAAADG